MAKILYTIEIHKIDPNLIIEEDCNVIQLVCDAKIDDDELLNKLGKDKDKEIEEILKDLSQQEGVDRHVIKKVTKGWKPRITQMVSWCVLALSKSSYLLQVGTGEGKSCIVAMFAAYRALQRQKVDIISSSPVLAERDAEAWRLFYRELGLEVGCNTNKSIEALKPCYKCHIVYGTTDSFAGDWLRHHFQRSEVRGDRKFHCVIVDEVDSLMLDKGLEMVYLSSDLPAMQYLDMDLSQIWCLVSQCKKLDCGRTAGPIQSFVRILQENTDSSSDTDAVLKLAEDKGIFPKGFAEDMTHLNSQDIFQKLECVDKAQIVDFFRLVEEEFPNHCYSLFSKEEDGSLKKLNKPVDREVGARHEIPILFFKGGLCRHLFSDRQTLLNFVEQTIRTNLQFTRPEVTPEDSYITGFQNFVHGKVGVWVENAFKATEMALGDEYIIQRETVVPVDYQCTGVVQNNMKWSDGLQQFLEMKHQTKELWETKRKLKMLQELYKGMQTCRIPSFRRRKLFEEEGQILNEEEEWLKAICSVVHAKVNSTWYRGKRAVLVLCETINRVKTIEKAITESVQGVNPKCYTNNNSDPSEITGRRLQARDVIIATNLAGRGTDLKVSEKVDRAGGLFVVQTFLPLNARVEQQAFGRTARQGKPGSAQLIMCASHFSMSIIVEIIKNRSSLQMLAHLSISTLDGGTVQRQLSKALIALEEDHSTQSWEEMAAALDRLFSYLETSADTNVTDAKEARDHLVSERLSSYLTEEIPKMTKKEDLFSDYLQLLDEIHEQHKNSNMLNAIVESMHECWGLWLLTRFNEDESKETQKPKFNEAMGNARELLEKGICPSSAVSFYVRYGNELRLQKCLRESVEIYSRALEANDHDIIALYNRALSVMQRKDSGYLDVALRDLEKAGEYLECFLNYTDETLMDVVKQGPNPPPGRITCFANQLCIRSDVLKCLKKNINEAVNKLKTAHNNAPLARVLLTELEPAATATELLLLMLEESEVEAELFAAGGALAADVVELVETET
ncbi:protein translocase subunit SecA-like [Clupea harengus]|uniref:Protein translocase subunit SecA-like n=1 Tax=Clupea harengus TaxID=7950 RepID=A0A8M1KXL4_CLUHA|nr:protein translocase subunit SecA-like [Clupea harengus]